MVKRNKVVQHTRRHTEHSVWRFFCFSVLFANIYQFHFITIICIHINLAKHIFIDHVSQVTDNAFSSSNCCKEIMMICIGTAIRCIKINRFIINAVILRFEKFVFIFTIRVLFWNT